MKVSFKNLSVKKNDIRKGSLGKEGKRSLESAKKRSDLKPLRRKVVVRRTERRARKKI